MTEMTVTDIIVAMISNLNFILAMMIIVLVAACFLGRRIKITKGMIISALFLFVFEAVGTVLLLLMSEKILQFSTNLLGDEEDSIMFAAMIENEVLNIIAFGFAFVFYLLAYKEKRLVRAIEASVCLYGYYYFIQTTIYNSAIFLSGTSDQVMDEIAAMVTGGPFLNALVLIDLAVDCIILAILYFVFYKPRRFFVVSVPYRVIFIIWILVTSLVMYVPLYTTELTERYRMLSIIIGLLIPSLSIIAPILIVLIATERSLKEKNEYQESYLKAELEYIEQYKRAQTETRAFRHDIINNLSLAKMLLDEGKTADANEHISELLGNVKSLSPKFVTGDEMLDLIVSMKADRMQEKDISFKCDGVADGGLHMKPMDVCSIFANALDNAAEASEGTEDASVDMSIKRTDRFFVVRISNSCHGIIDMDKLLESGFTSKRDKEHHGFGLRNIRDTVESYSGIIKAESEEGRFDLTIMLPR